MIVVLVEKEESNASLEFTDRLEAESRVSVKPGYLSQSGELDRSRQNDKHPPMDANRGTPRVS